MCLLTQFQDLDDCFYYPTLAGKNKHLNFDDKDQCASLIEEYFAAGHKEKAFAFDFGKIFLSNGKLSHTVAIYLLGYCLREIVDVPLQNFIKNNTHGYDYDFRHVWFLSSLYHDTASAIESVANLHKPLNFYLGANNVKFNVYDHIPEVPSARLFTYARGLVENYFDYRSDFFSCVDHGILGGFLLFDKLRKNYDDAWRDFQKYNKFNAESYDKFEWRCLLWKRCHLDLFTIIADSVIGHNIWVSQDVKLYNHYGLDPLINPGNQRISCSERPLLFFLSLLDTIEPVKCLERDDHGRLPPSIALKSVDIQLNSTNEITICILRDITNLKLWFDNIRKMRDWLEVEVFFPDSRTCKIKVL